MSKKQNLKASQHPAEILRISIMERFNLNQKELAIILGVRPQRINRIVTKEARFPVDIDLRLARVFGCEEGKWLRLQSDHDMYQKKKEILEELNKLDCVNPLVE